jgi:hypothetical protein
VKLRAKPQPLLQGRAKLSSSFGESEVPFTDWDLSFVEYMKEHRDFTPSFLLVCQGRSRSFLLVRSHRYLGDDDVVEFKVGRRRGGPSRTSVRGRISRAIRKPASVEASLTGNIREKEEELQGLKPSLK